MFAHHSWKETTAKRSAWHFSPVLLINITLLFALLVTSCVPSETTASVTEQTAGKSMFVGHFPGSDRYKAPAYDRPEPRMADGSDSESEPNSSIDRNMGSGSLLFIENVGQFEPDVRFKVQGAGMTAYLTNTGINLVFFQPPPLPPQPQVQITEQGPQVTPPTAEETAAYEAASKQPRKNSTVKISFPESNPQARLVPLNALETAVSFVSGSESFTHVPVWDGVRYIDIYPGADLEIRSENSQWFWRFVVRDKALFYSQDNVLARQGLVAQFTGQDELVLSDGMLYVSTDVDDARLPMIGAVQAGSRSQLDQNPKLDGNKLQIISPEKMKLDYSSSRSLRGTGVLAAPATQPAAQVLPDDTPGGTKGPLVYSSYLELYNGEYMKGIAADSSGAIYVTGADDYSRAVVIKIDPKQRDFAYMTTLNYGEGAAVAVDSTGAAYVTGYDTSYGTEAFIAKFDPSGALVYSNFILPANDMSEYGLDIAVDETGASYVLGYVSGTYPRVGFIAKYDTDGNLVYMKYTESDQVMERIALGPDHSVYLGGRPYNGQYIYIWRLSPDGTTWLYQRHLDVYLHGGNFRGLAVDRNGNAYASDSYNLVKLDPTGAQLTYIVDNYSDRFIWSRMTNAIAVDESGNVYLLGSAVNADEYVTPGAYAATPKGLNDLTITKLDPEGNILYNTYLGTAGEEGYYDTSKVLALDGDNNVNIFVSTRSGDFPTTLDAHARSNQYFDGSRAVGVVVKFDPTATVVSDESTSSVGKNEGGCFAPSMNSAQGTIGDPINTRTGGYEFFAEDISIPTSAGALTFARDYSSLVLDVPTALSPGWTFSHDTRLIMPDDPGGQAGEIRFKARTNNQYIFYALRDHLYAPAVGLCGTLVYEPGPPVRFRVTDSAQNSYLFDEEGVLLSYENSAGNSWEYTYDTGGRLTRVSADAGTQYLSLDYESERLASVSDHTGRSVHYDYDASGDLTTVTDVSGQEWTYTYTNHLLADVLDPDSHLIERTEYDPQGRAVRQYDGEGHLMVEIAYNTDGTTTIDNALGNTATHAYNERGELVSETDPAGGETSKITDANFRPFGTTDALGNKTTLEWSLNGINLTKLKDARGGVTKISYDTYNNPTSIVDPLKYETKYFYEDSNFPNLPTRIEYPLSFNNGATYIGTDYEYYPPTSGAFAGKVKFVTDALGSQTYYTYTSTGLTETVTTSYGTANQLTTTYDYDDLGRLINLTDEQGIVTHNEYDNAGHVLKTTRNYVPSRPQNDENKYNLVTEYRYDIRGNQIAVIDTIGVITRTYYDLANRPVTVVQNLAGQTIEAASPPARDGVSEENIRMDTIYDDAGNMIATIDPAGIITRTYYDAANRPVTTVQNLTGQDISVPIPPIYNPAAPDQNVRTDTVYDANGNVIAGIDTLGVITRTYYDTLNRPVTIVQNLTGQAISVATPPGRGTDTNIRTDTHYDANGNAIATVDPRGVITRTYYDALNRPMTVVQNLSGQAISVATPPAAGTEVNLRSDTYYDEVGNAIATVDPRGIVTRTYYDEANRPVSIVQNLVNRSIYYPMPPARGDSIENVRTDIAYDQYGRRDTTTDPRGHVTKYEYNSTGQLIKTIVNYVNGGSPQNEDNQRNLVSEYVYDALDRQIQTTDTLGRVTLNAYDDLGRLTSATQNYQQGSVQNYKDSSGDQYNLITTYSYDVRGNQIAVTDAAGVVTRTYYDALARPVSVVRNLMGQDPSVPFPPERADPPSSVENLRTDTMYLGSSNVDFVVDETGTIIDYTYDSVGRLITTLDPLQKSTSFAYDANGNRTSMTDAEGVTTKYEYDAFNRLSAVIENYYPAGQPDHETNVRTEYGYDEDGNRTSITDANGHVSGLRYNGLNLLDVQWDALEVWWAWYEYDSAGNMTRTGEPNENSFVISYEYDDANRMTSIQYADPATPDVSFSYDAIGRRTSMSDGLGTTTWDYNNRGLPNSITDPFAASVSYEYDEAGNRTSLTYPDSSVVNYEYNDVNRLTKVIAAQQSVASYQYDATGRLKMVQRPNGVSTLYNYYDNGWLQDITHSTEDTTLASYQYQYDNVGNRTQAVETMKTGVAGPTVQVDVRDSSGLPVAGKTIYAFNGNTYTGYNKTTDSNGRASITLPAGDYRFRVDVDGTQFWSDSQNHCTVGECSYVMVTVPLPVLVMVQDSDGTPMANIPVYAFNGSTYSGYHGTTDSSGQVSLRLPSGNYRFRADSNGTQFWSAQENHCAVPGCTLASVSVTLPVTVTVLDNVGMPHEGLSVYAFNGTTYSGYSAATDANGQVHLTLPVGNYRFRVDFNGTQFWSGMENHCTVPSCREANVAITLPLVVTVMGADGSSQQGLNVYAFNGTQYTGYSGITDENGRVTLTLPAGNYRFRADLNGTQFWSDSQNHCAVPNCTGAQITVTSSTTVTVTDTEGTAKAGVSVYAFNGTTYTGYSKISDANGQAVFTLPQGSYRFRADFNGTQFWSGSGNHCDVPGCTSATVTVTNGMVVTVQDTDGAPKAGLKVYAFNGSTYTGYNGITNENGQVTLTLPVGSYRFRADLNGTQFWSGTSNHCDVPGCGSASITVSKPMMVTVLDTDGAPKAGLNVYAFNGSTYTGYSKITNADGQAVFTLPLGSYRFRADLNGTQFWSDTANHCDIPDCENAQVTVTNPITVTILDEGGAPKSGVTVYAFNGSTYSGYSKVSDASGQADFTLPAGDYRFRADDSGTQYWSDSANHCRVPGCLSASVSVGPAMTATVEPPATEPPVPTEIPTEVPTETGYQSPSYHAHGKKAAPAYQASNDVTITVLDTDSLPQVGLNLYVFDGVNYTGFHNMTDSNGQVTFTLPDGNYRFRADLNGTQFWSGTENHCTLPGCNAVSIAVTTPVIVNVQDTDGLAKEGLKVYAFNGTIYTGYSSTTNASGNVTLTLPQGSYHFRSDLNGTQFWSGAENHCTLPGCKTIQVVVTKPITVTVQDTDGAAQAGLKVYAFNGTTYTGYSGTTDASGQVTLTLPQGSYRFRSDLNGTQFWSGAENHCTLPGCQGASITTTKHVLVTIAGETGQPYAGLHVYAFDGTQYTGYSGITAEDGRVTLTLPQGNYHFRADYNGVQFWSSTENACQIPGCETSQVVIPGGYQQTEVTIDYTYDPLYRLTAADYSNSDYYHYTYDAVGNRLTQTRMIDGVSSTDNYVYDDTNRLTSVNGVTYTWDDTGNLLSDGVNTYTYDAVNRLKTMTGPSVAASYAYNGLGDRLQETVDGQTTNFMMDYNTGLTQVLNDGTNNYIYGNGRIAQVSTGTEYFLGDALGSVRQLADASGAVTYASSYDPYGVVTTTGGSSRSVYGYTGEYTSNEMVYLRARHYAPGMGRFITRDTWGGDANSPMTFNRWSYVESNPINYTDPSGNFAVPIDYGAYYSQSLASNTISGSGNSFVGNISSLLLIANYNSCGNNTTSSQKGIEASLLEYGIELVVGTGGIAGDWTTDRKQAVLDGAKAVGSAFIFMLGGTAPDVFRTVYRTWSRPLVFVWGDKLEGMPYFLETDKTGKVIRSEKITAGCYTKGSVTVKGRDIQVIKCVSLSGHLYKDVKRMRNTIVHELGHLFNIATQRWGFPETATPYERLRPEIKEGNLLWRGRDTNGYYGFASQTWELNWQQHGCSDADAPGWSCQDPSEIFGDMFLGWTFNTWEKGNGPNGWSAAGEARAAWMKTNMITWLNYMRASIGG